MFKFVNIYENMIPQQPIPNQQPQQKGGGFGKVLATGAVVGGLGTLGYTGYKFNQDMNAKYSAEYGKGVQSGVDNIVNQGKNSVTSAGTAATHNVDNSGVVNHLPIVGNADQQRAGIENAVTQHSADASKLASETVASHTSNNGNWMGAMYDNWKNGRNLTDFTATGKAAVMNDKGFTDQMTALNKTATDNIAGYDPGSSE